VQRRNFITLLGGAATWPLAARAQQGERMRRIGALMGYAESDSDARAWYAAFRDALQKLGWTQGRNIQLDTRWATPDDAESMRRFAMELVALQPDVLLSSTTPPTTALLQQTRTIPIVFALAADSIGRGFVANLARPGGTAVSKLFGSKAGILWIHARRSTSAHAFMNNAFMNNAFTGKSRLDLPRPGAIYTPWCRVAFGKKQRPRSNGNDRRSTSMA